ncbi:glycoside hydrolase family 16 protein [Gordonia sp. LSe1-13]|uniref:Glycoside hydrolase family 16 protein n=1 Tax=Gordonia sesuvii TaxID=3116777 RepID=A0ABU7MBF4_9ACTN|nr:glycoside hydrolase family 16 protein [Gordonia sp. LSe1-13]
MSSADDRPGESEPTSTCVAPGSVSGVGAPSSAGPAWQQTFVDEFDRCALGDDWGTYSGSPGGNPVGEWDGSMVSVVDGTLRLGAERTSSGWVTGGVSNYPVTQTYGRWEVRMRADRSADLSYHLLLWPKNEQWPPEIDFAESVSPERTEMSAFVHWKQDGENRKANADTDGRFDQWHTVGVEWLPGLIRYLLDGEVWAEARSSTMVPSTPMWLGMQVEAGACERREDWGMSPCADDEPRPQSAAVEIDWVAVYRPSADFAANAGEYFLPTPGAIQISD